MKRRIHHETPSLSHGERPFRLVLATAFFLVLLPTSCSSFLTPYCHSQQQIQRIGTRMILPTPPFLDGTSSSSRGSSTSSAANSEPYYSSSQRIDTPSSSKQNNNQRRRRYQRKRIPETEKELFSLRQERQAEYERILRQAKAKGKSPNIWSFESLFPDPVWDEASIEKHINAVKRLDGRLAPLPSGRRNTTALSEEPLALRAQQRARVRSSSFYGGTSTLHASRDRQLSSDREEEDSLFNNNITARMDSSTGPLRDEKASQTRSTLETNKPFLGISTVDSASDTNSSSGKVDRDLTRLVEDRINGYRRTATGIYQYDTSLMGDGAVQFRDGVRLSNPLKVNSDRLNYLAKKEFQHGRVEEAQELYEQAVTLDPRDGRGYLGLSRCAQRRRDFELARKYLYTGISNSVDSTGSDRGANPFLTQALGCLEERAGHLSEAEELYLSAVRSRPSHAAAWVSLAQLRTRKLGQTARAGRECFQTAEKELKKAGKRPSSYVYTAWAAMEYHKAGDRRRARELFKAALNVDKKCSAAWLQLGTMEADRQHWKEAEECFESVLKFDQANSRVLQAYAIMETKRPDGSSRKAIDLFERALSVKPRDGGVLQAYALYVAELGDIDAARELLRRGTKVDKRHAPLWQAWGVLEMRHGSAEDARKIFQLGIWNCAQLAGSQSGGYRCARLWQAWGILESHEKDHAAARRCFSRALDADSRNAAAITAWAQMEESIGNIRDARSIFERALPRFAPGRDEKVAIWRSYELMEQRLGNLDGAQQINQRYMKEAISSNEDSGLSDEDGSQDDESNETTTEVAADTPRKNKEVEVVQWKKRPRSGEVWINDRAIEGRVPFDMKGRKKKQR